MKDALLKSLSQFYKEKDLENPNPVSFEFNGVRVYADWNEFIEDGDYVLDQRLNDYAYQLWEKAKMTMDAQYMLGQSVSGKYIQQKQEEKEREAAKRQYAIKEKLKNLPPMQFSEE